MNRTASLLLVTVLAALLFSPDCSRAQSASGQDTIQCFIVGFQVGVIGPSDRFSHATLSSGQTTHQGNMYSLYDAPWLDFGVTGYFKTKSNWLFSLNGDFWFGNDNLSHREQRMDVLFTREGAIIGSNGIDPVLTCFNRALTVQGGVGKIIPLWPSRNPNSGLLLRMSAGPMFQQTIFMLNEEHASQLEGDYALLYDHQRRGLMLTESLGFWFMSNRSNLVNFHVSFDVSQCWTRSTRDYVYDHYIGLDGKDESRYFDLLYSLKISWMFPLKGKTARDYYYY